MDIKEFGSIIRDIREDILEISQSQLAIEIKSRQGLVSRLENGKGATADIVFDVLVFLESKRINTHMIFFKPFDFAKLGELSEKQIKANAKKKRAAMRLIKHQPVRLV
jgi:predicted transcriptional regulator